MNIFVKIVEIDVNNLKKYYLNELQWKIVFWDIFLLKKFTKLFMFLSKQRTYTDNSIESDFLKTIMYIFINREKVRIDPIPKSMMNKNVVHVNRSATKFCLSLKSSLYNNCFIVVEEQNK